LISARLFCFDCSVLAKENGASLSTVDPATAGQNGVAAFATTHWSMVLTAQGDSPEADKALEKLCRTYWWPIYGFVRRQGHSPEEAQDLTQGFFAFLLERKGLDTVAPDKGLLRSFFLASVKNFLANARRGYSITRNIGHRSRGGTPATMYASTSSMRRKRCLATPASADERLTGSAGNRESHRSRQYSIR
jgi:DNA-directed RNA polymerase specialized sigma24 family protein